VEGMRRDMRENEKRWREKEKLEESIRELERRVGEMEVSLKKKREQREGEGRGGEGERREVVERMKEMEKRLERKERKERRKNILIRELEVEGEGKRKKAVEEVLEKIEAEVEVVVEEVRKIGRGEGKTETAWVRLKNEEQRNEVIKMKRNLKGKRERIVEDWTWKERKMRWRLEEIARNEMRKGRKVWMSYGGIKLDEKWWRWDEEEEVLIDEKGMMRKENTGEDMEM